MKLLLSVIILLCSMYASSAFSTTDDDFYAGVYGGDLSSFDSGVSAHRLREEAIRNDLLMIAYPFLMGVVSNGSLIAQQMLAKRGGGR